MSGVRRLAPESIHLDVTESVRRAAQECVSSSVDNFVWYEIWGSTWETVGVAQGVFDAQNCIVDRLSVLAELDDEKP